MTQNNRIARCSDRINQCRICEELMYDVWRVNDLVRYPWRHFARRLFLWSGIWGPGRREILTVVGTIRFRFWAQKEARQRPITRDPLR
jgi:hypothetical protein